MTAADRALPSPAARRTTLTFLARIGFAARGLIYLLVGVFAAATALGFGKEPHGIMDAVQAITVTRLRLMLAVSIGIGLACLATYFAVVGIWHCLRGGGPRRWLLAAGMLGDAAIYAAVMICILGLLFGWHADGEQQAHLWTAWAFGKPFGRALVGVAGFVMRRDGPDIGRTCLGARPAVTTLPPMCEGVFSGTKTSTAAETGNELGSGGLTWISRPSWPAWRGRARRNIHTESVDSAAT